MGHDRKLSDRQESPLYRAQLASESTYRMVGYSRCTVSKPSSPTVTRHAQSRIAAEIQSKNVQLFLHRFHRFIDNARPPSLSEHLLHGTLSCRRGMSRSQCPTGRRVYHVVHELFVALNDRHLRRRGRRKTLLSSGRQKPSQSDRRVLQEPTAFLGRVGAQERRPRRTV